MPPWERTTMEGCSQRLLCSIGQWLEATSSFHGKLRPESIPEPALGVLQNHNDGAVDPKFGATGKSQPKVPVSPLEFDENPTLLLLTSRAAAASSGTLCLNPYSVFEPSKAVTSSRG